MDGTRYKISIAYSPYFLVVPKEGKSLEVSRYLSKIFAGYIQSLEIYDKEDLDLPNHLNGRKLTVIKISFLNNTLLSKVKKDLLGVVKKNKEQKKEDNVYLHMLAKVLKDQTESKKLNKVDNPQENIIDIKEFDIPHHVRASIDLKLFCGLWYSIKCKQKIMELPDIKSRPDLIDRPDPIVLAFDIETTKLPLKFPDAQTDQIMMISYMVDAQGYLITNREIIAHNVEDFEYTPKPEFEGSFIVFNEVSEFALIKRFFDHIMEIKPHIFVTYNGDFFDWPFIEARSAFHGLDMYNEIGFSKNRDGNFLCQTAIHMDCLYWVKRDSYLPVGSQGLKAVAKAKLR